MPRMRFPVDFPGQDPRMFAMMGRDHVFVVDVDDVEVPFAPIEPAADWAGCRNAASVWNGMHWTPCEGPDCDDISRRCPDCDFRHGE